MAGEQASGSACTALAGAQRAAPGADVCISQIWRLKVQDQGAGRVRLWLAENCLIAVQSRGREEEGE